MKLTVYASSYAPCGCRVQIVVTPTSMFSIMEPCEAHHPKSFEDLYELNAVQLEVADAGFEHLLLCN